MRLVCPRCGGPFVVCLCVVGMWCSQCEQDVMPAASLGEACGLRCLHCGQNLEPVGDAQDALVSAPELRDLSQSLAAIPLDWDDWELDDDLRQAERLAQVLELPATIPPSTPLPAAPPSASPRPAPTTTLADEPLAERASAASLCAWSVLALGLMAFVCGAVLLAWSLIAGRPELLPLGLPLTLVGQGGWLIVTLIQMESLSHGARRTARELAHLRQRMLAWEQASLAARPTVEPPASLADLQTQVHRLSAQIERRAA